MKILSFGSLNIDNVYRVKTIVKPGETIASETVQTICGGKGLNQSIALSRAGMEVSHAGAVGEDGQILIQMLQDAGVNTDLIRKMPGRSGHTVIQVEDSGQNSIVLCGGSNQQISKEDINEVLDQYQENDLILLQNEISNLPWLLEQASAKKMRIILNPSPMDETLIHGKLDGVSLFLLNEIEGEQLSGHQDPEKILDTFAERYPQADVVLTLGKAGSIFQGQGQRIRQQAIRVAAVDTTAAGDTFTGYFVREYFETGDAAKALAIASRASAIAVTRPGAAPSIPVRSEVLEQM